MRLSLQDLGLPECQPCPWMEAVHVAHPGWDGGGLHEPTPGYATLWTNREARSFTLVTDIETSPVSFVFRPGTPEELADWYDEHGCERAAPSGTPEEGTGDRLREYADDPDAVERWWRLCDDCESGAAGLSVDVGDA